MVSLMVNQLNESTNLKVEKKLNNKKNEKFLISGKLSERHKVTFLLVNDDDGQSLKYNKYNNYQQLDDNNYTER